MIVTSAVLPIDDERFRESALGGGTVASSDGVQNDPRFAFELFRRSWGGQRPGLGGYVTGTGATRGVIAAGGR